MTPISDGHFWLFVDIFVLTLMVDGGFKPGVQSKYRLVLISDNIRDNVRHMLS